MQMMLERRRGNRLRLGVDERLFAPRRFETHCMSTVSIPRALRTMAGTICVGAML
jgi:hypothetical protein